MGFYSSQRHRSCCQFLTSQVASTTDNLIALGEIVMLATSNPLNSSSSLSTALSTTPVGTSSTSSNLLTTNLNSSLLNQSSSSSVNGLKAEYYEGTDLKNLKLTRTDSTVDFLWGTGSPAKGVSSDNFSVRWTGQIVPKYSDTYTFYTNSDDGVRLWLNGKSLVNNWTLHSPTENSGSAKLEAGKPYHMVMEYFESKGEATAQLSWSSSQQKKEIIPQSQLRSEALAPVVTPQPGAPVIGTGNGLKAEYFAGTDLKNLKLTRTDATVNFNWGEGSPDSAIAKDQFSVRWSGQVMPKYTETYTFYTGTDDGVRLWVNGKQLVNDWNNHPNTENKGTITLEAGKKYDIRVEYFEGFSLANAQLSWSSPSQTKEIIPKSQLFSEVLTTTTPTPTPAPTPAPTPTPGGGVVQPPAPIDYNEKPSVAVPGTASTINTTALPLIGISVSDPDAGNSQVTVTIKATDGTLKVNSGISGGVPLSSISNNGTATVVLVGTLLQINTTLANPAGLAYQPKPGFEGKDQVAVTINDNGNTGVGGALTDTQIFSVVVGAAGKSYPNSNSPLGTNLSQITYYSTELPFVDVFKMSDHFRSVNLNRTQNSTPLNLRSDGYPASLAAGQTAEATIVVGEAKLPSGKYTLFYEGEGELRVISKTNISSKNFPTGRMEVEVDGNGVWVQILSTNSANPVRNMRMIMPGHENTYQKDPWNPVFLERLSKFKTLRYMDFVVTNNSKVKEWSDRTTLTSQSQGDPDGAAWENAIALSNRLHTDAWINVPHQASDDYVRKLATLMRDTLDPSLKIYVEYSNEVWNGGFEQYHYASKKGVELGLSTDPFQANLRYYSQRSVEIFKIFEEVFGNTQRFERVLASQTVNTWPQEQVLTWKDAYKSADSLAIAPYFQGDLNETSKVDRTLGLSVNQALDILRQEIKTNKAKQISDSSKLADKYGLDLVGYEGGQHLVSYQFAQPKQSAVTDFFTRVNRDAGMKDVYTEYLNTWKANGGDLLVTFNSTSFNSKWGHWGALEYQNQPISQAPKYQAITEYIDKNPVAAK
jgi:hypothetical protein